MILIPDWLSGKDYVESVPSEDPKVEAKNYSEDQIQAQLEEIKKGKK